MVTSKFKCNTCTEHTSWENVLDCFGPFQQEAHGFLSPESIAVLKLGLRSQYGDSSDSRRDLLDLLSIVQYVSIREESGTAHLHWTEHHWTACWGCDCRQSPEVVPLKATGSKPQAVAVFPLDCSGVDLDAGSVALLPALSSCNLPTS